MSLSEQSQKGKRARFPFWHTRQAAGLNGLLASEGLAPVGEAECEELVEAYEN